MAFCFLPQIRGMEIVNEEMPQGYEAGRSFSIKWKKAYIIFISNW